MKTLQDFLQAMSNSAADTVAGPVDLLSMGLNKLGVPVGDKPIGGSNWQKEMGLRREVKQGIPRVLGETAGLLGPAMVAKFAPQIARAANQGAANLAAPQRLNSQAGKVLVGPRSEALDTAQRNAVEMLGLPPGNTPMDRAKALGFTDDVYHGTNADIRAFDPSLADSRRMTGTPAGASVVSSSPISASTYAGQSTDSWGNVSGYSDNGNVMPLMLRKEKNLSVNAKGANWSSIYSSKYPDAESTNDIAEIAFGKGKKTATVKNVLDNATWSKQNGIDSRLGDTTFVFDPSLIRSRFAAFDPARIKEADLLGRADPRLLGLLGAGVGGGLYLNKDD